jgi:hypothetical protein
MNNATLRVSDYPVETSVGHSVSQPAAPTSDSANQAVRDFFRRGDRGLYEGGPADEALDGSPTWNLPERAPIIRTPKQQARRIAAMWAEAVLMLFCVTFLATAALQTLGNSSTRSPTGNAEQPDLPAATRVIAAPRQALVQPAKPNAPVIARADSNLTPAKPVRVAMPVAPAPELSQRHAAAIPVTVHERKAATAAPTNPVLQRAPSARQTSPTTVKRTQATTTTSSVAPKRAVAAFPDD